MADAPNDQVALAAHVRFRLEVSELQRYDKIVTGSLLADADRSRPVSPGSSDLKVTVALPDGNAVCSRGERLGSVEYEPTGITWALRPPKARRHARNRFCGIRLHAGAAHDSCASAGHPTPQVSIAQDQIGVYGDDAPFLALPRLESQLFRFASPFHR